MVELLAPLPEFRDPPVLLTPRRRAAISSARSDPRCDVRARPRDPCPHGGGGGGATCGPGYDAHSIEERIEASGTTIGRPTASGRRVRLTAVFVGRAPMTPPTSARPLTPVDPDLLVVDINAWGAIAVAQGSAALGPPWRPTWCPSPRRTRHRTVQASLLRAVPSGGCAMPSSGRWSSAQSSALLPEVNAVRAAIDPRLPAVRTADDAIRGRSLALPDRRAVRVPPPLVAGQRADGRPLRVGAELPPPAWLDTPHRSDRPLATSSEYQADAILAQTAFDALADTEMSIIATLPSNDPEALRVPTNGRAERFVPHGPILTRASVAITHGGMGVTQKALAAGVPVVVVPFGRDQPEVARRVEVAGAGVRLPRARLRPDTLRAAVATAMDRRRGPGCRRRLSCGGRSGGRRLPHRGAAQGTHL